MKDKWFWFSILLVCCFEVSYSQQQDTTNEKLINSVIAGDWQISQGISREIITKNQKSALAIIVSDISKFLLHEPTKDSTGLSIYDYPYSDRFSITSIITLCDDKLLKYPSNENLIIIKAILYLKGLSNQNQTIENLEKALAINPDNVTVMSWLGSCYGGSKRFDDATKLFEKAIKLDSLSGEAYDGLGMIQMSSGNWSKAEEFFKKSIKCKDADAMSWFNLGSLLAAKSKFAEAEPFLRKAVVICPSLVEARWNLAGIYYQNGEKSKSIYQMKKIIEIAPTSDYANRSRNNLKQMEE